MSGPLTDVEGKLLLDRLNRRAKLFSSLSRGPLYYVWFHLLSLTAVAALVLFEGNSDGSYPTVLITLAGVLTTASAVGFGLVNNRMNVLIELLRQEGMLECTLAVPREGRQRQEPMDGKKENRVG